MSVQPLANVGAISVPDVHCRPFTANAFRVEQAVSANGINVDIRHFRWDESRDSHLKASAYYLDYSLGPRATGARLLTGRHHADVPPGDIVFLPKGAAFDAHCEPSEHRLLCLTYDEQRANQIFEEEGIGNGLDACFDVRIPQVRAGLARLVDEVANPGFGQKLVIESVALTLAVDLCRHFQRSPVAEESWNGQLANWRLRRLMERVEADMSGDLSIAELASECRMSARHLIRTFKNTVGTTLSAYIADARIARAKRMLVEDGAMIKVIAGQCGFASAAAFSAAFRKATGQTPRAYRETILR